MRKYHARMYSEWPRRQHGDPIFQNTNEAIYYAHIVPDRIRTYKQLKEWRRNAYQDLKAEKVKAPINFDRMFDLAVRAQFFRECYEEIERINEGIA